MTKLQPLYAHKIRIIFLLLWICPFHVLHGQTKTDSVSQKLRPLYLQKDFEIDGKLTDPVWNKATPVFIKYEWRPNDQKPARVQTSVKVLYSTKYLYLGFVAYDPHPSKIRAHITDRDQIHEDDRVGVILDTFHSNQHAYELTVNPRAIQYDAKWNTASSPNRNFDMIWYSKAALNDSGYTAVIKIPFKSLLFPDKKIQNWGVLLFRNYPRSKVFKFMWTNVSQDNDCQLCQSGDFVGMEGIENTHNLEFIPYALASQNSTRNNPGDPTSMLDNGPIKTRVGGSVSYAPTSTSEINAVINPDFSQVETDATQIGINNTFALQYSEKRPFFLKQSSLFKTDVDLFYSRTINNPLMAGKFTKRSNKYSLAFLTAYDRNTPFVVPGLLGSSTIQSNIGTYNNVFRGKYNIGSQSHLGGILTTRNQSQSHNYVGSVDWNFFLGGHYYFNGQATYSHTKELRDTTLFNDPRHFGQSQYDAAFNGQQFGGTFLKAEFQRQAKYYDFSVRYHSLAPTFQSQSGFINQVDRRKIEASQSISYYPGKAWISSGNVQLFGSLRYDFDSQFQKRFAKISWDNHFAGQTSLSVDYFLLNAEHFRGYYFTKLNRINIDLKTVPSNIVSLSANFETGPDIYRIANPRRGYLNDISASTTVQPTNRLKLDLSYNYSSLSVGKGGNDFYSGNIARLKGNYSFSRYLFVRLITQYNSFNKQIQIYPLLSYKFNAFTKFYIGMTDYMKHYAQSTPRPFYGYQETNRAFFVKFQYLFRK